MLKLGQEPKTVRVGGTLGFLFCYSDIQQKINGLLVEFTEFTVTFNTLLLLAEFLFANYAYFNHRSLPLLGRLDQEVVTIPPDVIDH